jgi:hypothetical protein
MTMCNVCLDLSARTMMMRMRGIGAFEAKNRLENPLGGFKIKDLIDDARS